MSGTNRQVLRPVYLVSWLHPRECGFILTSRVACGAGVRPKNLSVRGSPCRTRRILALQGGEKSNNKITDLLHKLSRKLIEMLLERGVSTVVIGELKGVRDDVNYGSRMNQRLHQ